MLRNLLLGGASPLALFAPETGGGAPAAPAPPVSEGTVAPATPSTPQVSPPAYSQEPLTLRQATEQRMKRQQEAADKPTPVRGQDGKFAAAAPAESSGDEPQDAAPIEASGETDGADPAELPPVDPPSSWTKEDKEWFAELPPEKQARIAEREKLRDADFSRRQNEATKAKQDAEAERQAIAQQRQQYEQALPQLLERLQRQAAGEFADIKTHDDVLKMATEDPFRFNRWQAHQGLLAETQREVEATQRRQADEQRKTFETWATEQDKKFLEQAKDFADPAKAPKLREGIANFLIDKGVPKEALPGLWNNSLFRDAISQSIFYDAYRWSEAQKAAKAAAAKTTSAPTRPGTTPPKGAATTQAAIQQAEAKLAGATSTHQKILAATELRALRQRRAA